MNSQSGSVLAGVLVLSLVMSIAVLSLLMTSSTSTSTMQNAFDQRRLYYAAEGALQVGIRRMRDYTPDGLRNLPANGDTVGISSTWPGFTTFDETRIRVAYVNTVQDSLFMLSWANYSGGSETLRMSWKVTNISDVPGNWGMTQFRLETHRDTVLRYYIP